MENLLEKDDGKKKMKSVYKLHLKNGNEKFNTFTNNMLLPNLCMYLLPAFYIVVFCLCTINYEHKLHNADTVVICYV